MIQYRDPDTKLPLPSYDLWEEKRGCSTFTAAAVYGALVAAADLAKILGKSRPTKRRYRQRRREYLRRHTGTSLGRKARRLL